VARAEALLGSARALLFEAIDASWSATCAGSLDAGSRARLRLAATNVARACAEAVDLMYDAGGGSSIYESGPLQRCFRDAHAVTQHAAVAPATYELAGRVLLDLPTDTSML
jgi:alkylation response protein AidB-like acyl-CoA dehydrogenase